MINNIDEIYYDHKAFAKKLIKEGYSEVSAKIGQLKMRALDGKMRETGGVRVGKDIRIDISVEILLKK